MKQVEISNQHPDFSVFFVDPEPTEVKKLEDQLSSFFPNIRFSGTTEICNGAPQIIEDICPDIVFFDLQQWKKYCLSSGLIPRQSSFETIVLIDSEPNLIETIQNSITGYLLKPVKFEILILVVQYALQRIREKAENLQQKRLIQTFVQRRLQETPIGIPTIEGYEFLVANEIIRCEGLQKYTRVITTTRTDTVSSYNLGEFKNLLEPYGFFSPHRSHLINLRHIKKYHKEGSICMSDGANVPVSQPLKKAFLEIVQHL